MITRIVKMTFQPNKTAEFVQVFEESKEKIRNFPGCQHLSLLNAKLNSTIFFTYSKWDSEVELDNYRKSELFQTTWAKTKILFAERAEAWTVEELFKS